MVHGYILSVVFILALQVIGFLRDYRRLRTVSAKTGRNSPCPLILTEDSFIDRTEIRIENFPWNAQQGSNLF